MRRDRYSVQAFLIIPQYLTNLTGGIIEVPEDPALGQAGADAERLGACFHALGAEGAFGGLLLLFRTGDSSVRTGPEALSTSGAYLLINQHNAVSSLGDCSGRTRLQTPGGVTVIAEHRQVMHAQVRKVAGRPDRINLAPEGRAFRKVRQIVRR